jgi:uncharacterized cupredoxin-like copper-binding protein
MTAAPPTSSDDRPRASRAPIVVLLGAMALAIALVLLGARLAAVPAAVPDLSRPGTGAEPRSVNVILRDYAFNPTTLHLVAGETVQFNIVNGGLIEHEFVLGDGAVQQAWARAHASATPPGPFTTAPPASVAPTLHGVRALVPSGESTTVAYEVPVGITLELMCHLPGHVEQGMVGRVEMSVR